MYTGRRMEAGRISRLGMAALVAVACAAAMGVLAITSTDAESGEPTKLLPDLIAEKPGSLYLQKRAKATRLRLSNTVSNVGTGPLELYSDGKNDAPCHIPGKPKGRKVYQRVFHDSEEGKFANGYFDRDHESTFGESIDAGCMRFHPRHDHWHFDGFASYRLYKERNGKPAGRGRKVSFCVIDTERLYRNLPGSPARGFYTPGPFSSGFGSGGDGYGECTADSTDGLSIGWADTYDAGLPGQTIDITGQRSGIYCLVLTTDPDDRIDELDESNNMIVSRVRIRLAKNKVKRLKGACQAPGLQKRLASL